MKLTHNTVVKFYRKERIGLLNNISMGVQVKFRCHVGVENIQELCIFCKKLCELYGLIKDKRWPHTSNVEIKVYEKQFKFIYLNT